MDIINRMDKNGQNDACLTATFLFFFLGYLIALSSNGSKHIKEQHCRFLLQLVKPEFC